MVSNTAVGCAHTSEAFLIQILFEIVKVFIRGQTCAPPLAPDPNSVHPETVRSARTNGIQPEITGRVKSFGQRKLFQHIPVR